MSDNDDIEVDSDVSITLVICVCTLHVREWNLVFSILDPQYEVSLLAS